MKKTIYNGGSNKRELDLGDMLNVLFVDDEEHLQLLVRQKFRTQLNNGTYEFHYASNGLEALDIITRHPEISVVFSDIEMPEMNGIDLFNHLHDKYHHLHVVLMSAYVNLEEFSQAIKAGEYEFLSKPLDLDDIGAYLLKCGNTPSSHSLYLAKQHEVDLQEEIRIAHDFQQAMLPSNELKDNYPIEIAGHMHASKGVSGDMYDYFHVDPQHLAIVIADVSGQGIKAALFIAMFRTLIRMYAKQSANPGECLRQVNEYLLSRSNNSERLFVAAFYGVLDLATGEFIYANGGHIAPMLIDGDDNNNCVAIHMPKGLVLGVQQYNYDNLKIDLRKNNQIIIHTDGLNNCFPPSTMFFKEMVKNKDSLAVKTMIQYASERLLNELKEIDVNDDITILLLRWCGN